MPTKRKAAPLVEVKDSGIHGKGLFAALARGVMRHRVLGLEAVLGNGKLFSDLKKVSKSNEGYGLRHLLIGAEGTLGIITAAALKLFPRPSETVAAFLAILTFTAAVTPWLLVALTFAMGVGTAMMMPTT